MNEIETFALDTRQLIALSYKAAQNATGVARKGRLEVKVIDAVNGKVELTIHPEKKKRK